MRIDQLSNVPLQDVFDFIATHLLTQMEKAGKIDVHGEFQCLYRDSSGLKCAVGCLIPDALYDKRFEGESVTHITEALEVSLGDDMMPLLRHVQCIHDDCEPGEWRVELRKLANDLQLSTTVLS